MCCCAEVHPRERAVSKLKRHTRTDRADSTSAAATVVITLNGHKLNLTGPVLCGVLAHYGTTFCHTHSLTHSAIHHPEPVPFSPHSGKGVMVVCVCVCLFSAQN